MRVSIDWMKKYAALDAAAERVADRLTMTGTEVEEIDDLSNGVTNVKVGRIDALEPHPNADRLRICRVDVGAEEPLQIVTGAPNVRQGQKVIVALNGAKLPGGTIKTGKLRGEVSCGMLCSGGELGHPELDEIDGILELQENAPVGMDAMAYLGLADTVLDCKAYANRPDCLSVVGVAREAAAAMDVPFRMPEIAVKEEGAGRVEDHVSVTVEAPDLCPRYMARVFTDIHIEPSPLWMQKCLRSAGMRPINNLVDITNYVMLELGQPLHAFDLSQIRGNRIVVRRAGEGASIRTLDGKDRALEPEMLVIADGEGPVALAGVMGGENSEIEPTTRAVMLESAKFMPASVRATSRALGLRTEASARYEKGIDIVGVERALNRAAQLVEELGAGKVERGTIDVLAGEAKPVRELIVDPRRIDKLLGLEIPDGEKVAILNRLQIGARLVDNMLVVELPSHREDLQGEADIAEEVLRIYGFEHIRPTLMAGELVRGGRSAAQRSLERLKDTLVGEGFTEIVTYSFMSAKDLDRLRLPAGDAKRDLLAIRNPLGEDQGYMRNTLLPAMLSTIAYNANRHTAASLSLFEVSKEFVKRPGEELPLEVPALCLGQWNAGDFFALKGAVEVLGRISGVALRFQAGGDECWHPGRRARILLEDEEIGQIGEVHEEVAAAYGVEGRAYLCWLHTDRLVNRERISQPQPLPKVPAVSRDLAVTVREECPAGEMTEALYRAGGKLLERAEIFDVYRGPQVGEGMKSVAWSLTFQPREQTLTDEAADAAFAKLVKALGENFGAELRK